MLSSLCVGILMDGMKVSLTGVLGVDLTRRSLVTAVLTSSGDETGVSFTAISTESRSSDFHFGILAAGVADAHSLSRRRPLSILLYSDNPSVGCIPRDDIWCVMDAP